MGDDFKGMSHSTFKKDLLAVQKQPVFFGFLKKVSGSMFVSGNEVYLNPMDFFCDVR